LVVVKASELIRVPEGLDAAEAAALPLVLLTGEQLIRLGTNIQKGQAVLVTGAMGGVGRAAVWAAKEAGAVVIAGVRKRQLKAAEELGADHVLALDDSAAMAKLGFVDAVANTVGAETAQTLLGKVKPGGIFATVVTPVPDTALHPTVQLVRVRTVPDAATLARLVADVAAGRFKIPIDRMVPLAQVAEAQVAAEKGGIGKVLLLP
jgi:NADPH:quinone reductase-like Zn-dependent oxidoreductase